MYSVGTSDIRTWCGRLRWLPVLSTIVALVHGIAGSTVVVQGAGASFPGEVYGAWIRAYTQKRAKHVNLFMEYDSIGSAVGMARIKGEQEPMIHYAGSDYPLTDADKKRYPDLVAVPTLVGAVVITYNLPGINHLVLSLEAVTGMYNGSIVTWNDPIISSLNPGETLPDVPIIVISRSDKSGTTEALTRGLSVYSSQWNSTYGTFSDGLTEDGFPVKWNESAIKFFGHTNRGMHGLIVSLRFSAGYMSIADVKAFNMPYAAMKNRDGHVVNVNLISLQSAVRHANGSFELMNLPGRQSYPLVTYTYFVVNMIHRADCSSVVELVRYMDWFYHSEIAKAEAIHFNFTPLDSYTIDTDETTILKTITCKGKSVWTMMLNKILEESIIVENNIWTLPTYLTTCVLLGIIITLIAAFGHQQLTIHRQLLKEAWMITPQIIDSQGEEGRNLVRMNGNWFGDDIELTEADNSIFNAKAGSDKYILGLVDDHVVTLVRSSRINSRLTLKQKRLILKTKDVIKHTNVMKIIGFSNLNSGLHICYLGQIKVSLQDFLKSSKVRVREAGNIAIVKDIISGLKYLHRKGIVHGYLKASNIAIDSAWNIQIMSWIENHLAVQDRKQVCNRVEPLNISNRPNENEKALLWLPPEMLMFNRCPTYKHDVYSFGMVLQEIFSRKDPYHEIGMPVSEIIDSILTDFLRPQIVSDTPDVVSALMEKCWNMDPTSRPSINTVEHLIKNAYPKNTPLLDTLIESLKEYAVQLELELEESLKQTKSCKMKHDAKLSMSLPKMLASTIADGLPVNAKSHEETSVMAFKLTSLTNMLARLRAQDIIDILNYFYERIDVICMEEKICRITRFVPIDLYVSGLPKPNPEHAVVMSHSALRIITSAEDISDKQLKDLGCSFTVSVAIASGSLVAGILGKNEAQYVAFGEPLSEAVRLLEHTEPGMVLLTEKTVYLLRNEKKLFTKVHETQKGKVFTLDSKHG